MSSHQGPSAAGTPPTPPTIAQAVDRIFTRFDGNTNASITSAELLAILDPKGTHTALATAVTQLITAVDSNGDGSLSKAEVTAAITTLDTDGNGTLDHADHTAPPSGSTTPNPLGLLLGRGPVGHGHGGPGDLGTPPTPPTIAQVVDGAFARFDTNASTTISLTELLAVLDPSGTHTERDAALTTLFAQVDTNADSSLSVAEVTAALTALDTNLDGVLDRADHSGQPHDAAVDLIGVLLHAVDGHGPGC